MGKILWNGGLWEHLWTKRRIFELCLIGWCQFNRCSMRCHMWQNMFNIFENNRFWHVLAMSYLWHLRCYMFVLFFAWITYKTHGEKLWKRIYEWWVFHLVVWNCWRVIRYGLFWKCGGFPTELPPLDRPTGLVDVKITCGDALPKNPSNFTSKWDVEVSVLEICQDPILVWFQIEDKVLRHEGLIQVQWYCRI